jgi:hypothetical protein
MLLFFTLIFLLNELQPIFMLYTSQGFVIENSNNVHIDGLTFVDSPQMHIAFERSTWVHATSLTIQAPKDSPNTDGIHIQHSQNIIIDNIRIATGISFMEYSFFICFIIVFSFSFSFLNEYGSSFDHFTNFFMVYPFLFFFFLKSLFCNIFSFNVIA